MNSFFDLERLRRERGMSAHRMCKGAGVHPSSYFRARAGQRILRPATLRKLVDALSLTPIPKRKPRSLDLIAGAYRGYVAALAPLFAVSPAVVLAADPSRKATMDPTWALAAKVRAVAVYCTVTEFGVPAAIVARAIGVTKQAASLMLRRVEDLRDDPLMDAAIESSAALIGGRAA